MSDVEEEGGFWSRISGSDRIMCDNCGHGNPHGAEICEECSTPLPGEGDDEETLNTVIGEVTGSHGKMKKVPLQDAKHLKNLRKACEGVEAGTMTKDEYRQVVRPIYTMTQMGVNLFKSDVVKKKLDDLPPEEVELVKNTQNELERYHDGVSLMLGYIEIGNPAMARAGFNTVEDALTKLDRLQDRAIDIASAL
ncbi:MAG: hypothetical protein RDV48_05345 [Candidatus Eremiobacteraeota bacterium]|nr:hypothetical protein [Candidatus Eremiobacteraeota bacterium]